jgi:hypothetical protein
MESIRKELQDSQIMDNLSEAAKSMQNGEKSSGMLAQEKAKTSLQKAAQKMSALAAGQKQKGMSRMMAEYAKGADELLCFSFDQESLLTQENPESFIRQRILTGEMENILSFFLTLNQDYGFSNFALLKELSVAVTKSKQAEKDLSEENREEVYASQQMTLGHINQSILLIRQQMEQMNRMAGGEGASLSQLLQSLFSLSAEQMAMNDWINDILQQVMKEGASAKTKSEQSRAASAERSLLERTKSCMKK